MTEELDAKFVASNKMTEELDAKLTAIMAALKIEEEWAPNQLSN